MDHPIKLFREAQGLTQEQVGALAGVKKAVVSKWENGVPPSAASAMRLEEATEGKISKSDLRPDLWPREAAE